MTVLTGGAEHTDTLVSGVRGVRGSIFADTFTGTDGNSEHFRGRGGDDTIDGGGAGDGDQTDYLFAPGRVDVDLADDPDDAGPFTGQASNDGYGTTDLLANIENVRGSFNSDTVRGDGNANQLLGNGTGTTCSMVAAATMISRVATTNDTLIGGAGNDDLQGGNGIDEADYSGAAGVVTADLHDDPDVGGPFTGRATADGDGGVDRLSSIEWLRGGANGDTLAGNGTQNRLRGRRRRRPADRPRRHRPARRRRRRRHVRLRGDCGRHHHRLQSRARPRRDGRYPVRVPIDRTHSSSTATRSSTVPAPSRRGACGRGFRVDRRGIQRQQFWSGGRRIYILDSRPHAVVR